MKSFMLIQMAVKAENPFKALTRISRCSVFNILQVDIIDLSHCHMAQRIIRSMYFQLIKIRARKKFDFINLSI